MSKNSTSRSPLLAKRISSWRSTFESLNSSKFGLNEDSELTFDTFTKGLSPSIANKVELQPYLSFEEVCNLAIKIEK